MLRQVQISYIVRDDNGIPLAHIVRDETALVLDLDGLDCPDGGRSTTGSLVRDLDPDIVGLLEEGTLVLVDGCSRHEGTTLRELVRRKSGGFMLRTLGRPRHNGPDPVRAARLLGHPLPAQAPQQVQDLPAPVKRPVGRPAANPAPSQSPQETPWPLVPRSIPRSSGAGPASLLLSPDPLVPRSPPASQQSP